MITKLFSFKVAIFSFLIFIITNTGAQETSSKKNVSDAQQFKARYSAKELLIAPVKLIPYPVQVDWGKELITINEISLTSSKELTSLLRNELLNFLSERKINFFVRTGFSIQFTSNNSLPDEGYTLHVNTEGINIEAKNETGHFYALQTLRQLIVNDHGVPKIHLCTIIDKPAYPIRGYMIDVGRNYQSLESIKRQLDLLAKYKLNTFHWHLTDRPAWRIESKLYPELTAAENHRPTRNPGKFYTYNEIREVIEYARQRKITVIPEIDMPGHSDSFRKSMNCRMESKKGMEILTNVLNEFFEEIPKELAPMIHIGSDEVNIPNPKEFMERMVSVVESNGREVIIWAPGLDAPKSVIRQTWGIDEKPSDNELREINSGIYMNGVEPMSLVNNILFQPISSGTENKVIGGITCLWPDVNMLDENDAFKLNPYYSTLLCHAWSTWTACVQTAPHKYVWQIPPMGTEAADYFYAFETYLLEHKDRYFKDVPFNYFLQSDKEWRLIGPFDKNDGDKILEDLDKSVYTYQNKQIEWIPARGNTLVFNQRWEKDGYFPAETKAEKTVYALTHIHSNEEKEIEAWIGFETPLRANRIHTGIPENGEWDINGGAIYINDKKLEGPNWNNPGWKTNTQKDWGSKVEQEIPWTDEELYWTRTSAKIKLEKGWNKIFVKIPCATNYQNWMFTFVPLDMKGLRFSSTVK